MKEGKCETESLGLQAYSTESETVYRFTFSLYNYKYGASSLRFYEPVWPSGKALGW